MLHPSQTGESMRRMRIVVSLLGLLAGLSQASIGATRGSEEAVFEAVVVAKLRDFRAAARANASEPSVFCIAINPGEAPQTPSREFLARFKDQLDVRPAGQCEARRNRVVEIGGGRRALLLTVGPVEWVSGDEAWVTVTVQIDHPYPLPVTYRVVKEREGWSALGPMMKIAPA
jgi:hypothetical protein